MKLREIVAIKYCGMISNKLETIIEVLKSGQSFEMLERVHMQLMAAADLGPRWKALANGPTLFCVDDAGGVYKPTGEKL